MTATELIILVALGGLMGAMGQVVRVAVGLKKLSDTAAEEGKKMAELFEPSRLVVSLLIGFTAGAIAIVGLGGDDIVVDGTKPIEQHRDLLLGLMAAGYSSADVIEGFVKRHLPGQEGASSSPLAAMREPDAGQATTPPPAMG